MRLFKNRDWTIIILLYSVIALMFLAAYLTINLYVQDGIAAKAKNCIGGNYDSTN
jgi:hypothetical protein